MPRALDGLTVRRSPYAKAHGLNPEGFPSFRRSLEEGYLQVLLTNTLSGTFYATQNQLLSESLALHAQMAVKDTNFMARAIVYARREGLMRLQPVVGLAYLAKADRPLMQRIFGKVILTPGDLADFVEIVRGGVVPGGMGRSIKSAVSGWLNSLSEYHAIKYATGGQGYSLRDMLRIAHPKPITPTQDAIFLWLTEREKWAADPARRALTPQIDAFERLKRLEAGADQAEARAIIAEGRLPYEVVTGVFKPDLETWRELMRQMPYLALLRHLNTLQRAGVLAESESAAYVAERLSAESAIKQSKVLPFQLYTAYRMFTPQHGAEKRIAEALIDAMEAAFVNMPPLGDQVVIAPDVSGSMSGHISRMNATRFIDIAGIFTGALLKSSPSALVLPFETHVVNIKLSVRDTIMTSTEKLAQIGGGGTAVSAPVSFLIDKRVKVDTFIGITDNIEWATDQSGRHGFLAAWNEYTHKVAPQAKAFLVTIAPYRHAVAPGEAADIHSIYGWSDSVLKYISLAAQGLTGQVDAVRAMDI